MQRDLRLNTPTSVLPYAHVNVQTQKITSFFASKTVLNAKRDLWVGARKLQMLNGLSDFFFVNSTNTSVFSRHL